jgi:hypothetical protein
MDEELLGMLISELVYRATGFGPSQSITRPFAAQVLAEAKTVNYQLKLERGNDA